MICRLDATCSRSASYVPGAHLNLPDIGGSQQIEQNYISVHGSGSIHDTYMLDGMLVNTTYADGQIQQYIDNAAIQESTYQSSNVTAEASGGGMLTNLVPRDGGNQFHVQLFAGGSGGSGFWQANNLDQNLANRGLGGQDKTIKIEDFDGSFGGPIKGQAVVHADRAATSHIHAGRRLGLSQWPARHSGRASV